MSIKSTPASELKTGDKIHFPNSRHAQEITFISRDTQNDEEYVTVQAGEDIRWVLPATHSVNVEVDSE